MKSLRSLRDIAESFMYRNFSRGELTGYVKSGKGRYSTAIAGSSSLRPFDDFSSLPEVLRLGLDEKAFGNEEAHVW